MNDLLNDSYLLTTLLCILLLKWHVTATVKKLFEKNSLNGYKRFRQGLHVCENVHACCVHAGVRTCLGLGSITNKIVITFLFSISIALMFCFKLH